MSELTVGPQRPVQSAAPAAQTYSSPEAKRAPDAPAAERRDVMELSGKSQSAREVTSAEQALGKLHEMGILESASRPLSEEAVPPDAEHMATLTVRLDAGEEQAAGAQTEAAGETAAETEEEWQPYQPPSAVQNPPSVSEDGQSVTLYLFQTGDGRELFFNMNGIFLPLNADGALLAGLLDGSFRMLTLDMDMLELLLGTGQAVLDLLLGEEPDMADLPAASGGPASAAQPAAPGEAADEAEANKTVQTGAPDRPGTSEIPAEKPAAEAPRPEGPPAVKTEVPPPDARAENVGTWAAMRAVERSFQDMAQKWMTEFPDQSSPEALARWDELQRQWVSDLEQNDPPAFRAWLEVHVGRDTSDGVFEKALLPEGFTRADYENWMASDILSYESKSGLDSGVQWLLSQIVRIMLPEEREKIVSQSGYSAAGEVILHSGEDENKSLARRLPEIMAQLLSGAFRASTAEQTRDMDLPPYPERGEDERERAWKRRRIAYEVDSDWTANLKQWLIDVDGWRISRGQNYVNGKANVWSTDLMNGRPAQFRQWLSSPVRYAASTGWFNRATGSFPINTLPEGFTDEDLHRWLLLDVLDYL